MTNHRLSVPAASEGTLHRPDLEKDACGVGLVAHIQGERSNRILRAGLTSCCNVIHRGPLEADKKTGDGAGITTQIPYAIFLPAVEALGGKIADPSDLAVGVFFLPTDETAELKARVLIEGVVRNRGLRFIGWREVPVNPAELGEKARECMPAIRHLLIGRPEGISDEQYERELFLARREIEKRCKTEDLLGEVYSPSFSSRTISYKAYLVATALEKFYLDLQNPEYETAIALYHQRFSTNTFPSWSLAQPFRMLAHNGEINTLKGNRNWFRSRETDFSPEIWGNDVHLLHDLLDPHGSDSASLDSALELLVLSGRSPAEAMSILVPPAWQIDPETTPEEEAYYQYHSCFAEPWDGPASLAFTNGVEVCANLDRNGLRPARFKITSDGLFTIGSEVGVVKVKDETVIQKGRLAPGEMISIDTRTGEVRFDDQINRELADRQPYGEWLNNRVDFPVCDPDPAIEGLDPLALSRRKLAFGYTSEEIDIALTPLFGGGNEAIHSMGDDVALSILSTRPRLLSTYFKQLFAQVTNPPIDSIRERAVMSLAVSLGWQRDLLSETPDHAEVVGLETPFLFPGELEKLKQLDKFPAEVLDITFPVADGPAGLEAAIDALVTAAEAAVDREVRILVLSDRAVGPDRAPIPALMATGAVHHHLSKAAKRMRCGLVLETGEARDTHQMACLFGFGAQAICPWLAVETFQQLLEDDKAARKPKLEGITLEQGLKDYRSGLEKGVLKIMSKIGIAVLSSYQGAQIFEAVGIAPDVIDRCFAGTPSQIKGLGFEDIAAETLARHDVGYGQEAPEDGGALKLGDPGYFRYRKNGDLHLISGPTFLKPFHSFVRDNDPADYKKYVEATLENRPVSLHDLMEFVPAKTGPVPIEEVEGVRDITVRFTTAAMSLGAISPEAHEALAIAMNAIGGKSDSGEGGEDPARFETNKNSKIKQIASGRFGVSAEYLANAEELEIKMAQGAKPGEGGQLPGFKVNSLIAKLRNTVPGVTLISPPPHHDIYSIEDLAQLIHDLKEVNPRARVCVKLVAESGVGTVAAGVVKANADIVLISGHDGGTGASPLSSIKHAGLPWELGLAETQQVLMLNGLRDRVTLRTDGGMKNGRDIVTAALLGAEEFNFGTLALIALGCVYVRQCHLNTCPVGIATQDPKFIKKFKGDPQHVINFFDAVAQETREIMAELGYTRLDDLIGRTEHLRQREVPDHPKANLVDLSRVLRDVAADRGERLPRRCLMDRNDGLHPHPLDDKILQRAHAAIKTKQPVELAFNVSNTDRNVGTKLSGEIAWMHGNTGLPENTVNLKLTGSVGQSFGTFLVQGVSITLVGEANDYVGKGMCGGEIVIRPRPESKFNTWENSILGNTVLYGATGGRLFAAGLGGERFCVRNSGSTAVVEGIGDHGCEYMTGGTVVVLGRTGKNFGAGMSGGQAYLYDEAGNFGQFHNTDLTKAQPLSECDEEEIKTVQELIYAHLEKTDSPRAKAFLDDWDNVLPKFVKVSAKNEPTPPAYDLEEEQAAAVS